MESKNTQSISQDRYLNEAHRKKSERCMGIIAKLRQHPLSRQEADAQLKRNEKMLTSNPLYSQKF